MKKRFVVAVDTPISEEQKKAFREYVRQHGAGWWNWIDGLWLLVDPTGRMNAESLRDTVTSSFPGQNNIVLEFPDEGDDTWSGFGPNTAKKNMFPWLTQNWKVGT